MATMSGDHQLRHVEDGLEVIEHAADHARAAPPDWTGQATPGGPEPADRRAVAVMAVALLVAAAGLMSALLMI